MVEELTFACEPKHILYTGDFVKDLSQFIKEYGLEAISSELSFEFKIEEGSLFLSHNYHYYQRDNPILKSRLSHMMFQFDTYNLDLGSPLCISHKKYDILNRENFQESIDLQMMKLFTMRSIDNSKHVTLFFDPKKMRWSVCSSAHPRGEEKTEKIVTEEGSSFHFGKRDYYNSWETVAVNVKRSRNQFILHSNSFRRALKIWKREVEGAEEVEEDSPQIEDLSQLFWKIFHFNQFELPTEEERQFCFTFRICTTLVTQTTIVQNTENKLELLSVFDLEAFKEVEWSPFAQKYKSWKTCYDELFSENLLKRIQLSCVKDEKLDPVEFFKKIQRQANLLDPTEAAGFLVVDASFRRGTIISTPFQMIRMAIWKTEEIEVVKCLKKLVHSNSNSDKFLSFFPLLSPFYHEALFSHKSSLEMAEHFFFQVKEMDNFQTSQFLKTTSPPMRKLILKAKSAEPSVSSVDEFLRTLSYRIYLRELKALEKIEKSKAEINLN